RSLSASAKDAPASATGRRRRRAAPGSTRVTPAAGRPRGLRHPRLRRHDVRRAERIRFPGVRGVRAAWGKPRYARTLDPGWVLVKDSTRTVDLRTAVDERRDTAPALLGSLPIVVRHQEADRASLDRVVGREDDEDSRPAREAARHEVQDELRRQEDLVL